MGFRSLLIENELKISLRLGNVVITKEGEDIWLPINDVNIIVVDTPKVTISSRILCALAEAGICIVICDHHHLPVGYYGAYDNHSRSSKILKMQIEKSVADTDALWKEIVTAKIENQAEVITRLIGREAGDGIRRYISDIQPGDPSNREGHAARQYFNLYGGSGFSRRNDDMILNSGLNYGYAIVRSYLAKVCVSVGLNTQIGIHHRNEYNRFNLVDDLLEPIRPFVDLYVIQLMKEEEYFKPEHRRKLVNLLNHMVKYKNKKMYLSNALEDYVEQAANWFADSNAKILFLEISGYMGEQDEL